MALPESALQLSNTIARHGFSFVHGNAMRELLAPFGSLSDWQAFADSWNMLEIDPYMVDGARYRRRRHATFGVTPGSPIRPAPRQPHYQSPEYNSLYGGIARCFEPVAEEIVAGRTLQTILAFCRSLFDTLAGTAPAWHIEVHQFRIEARPGEQGRPTPEGVHRDGVDYVLVLLISRCNIVRGLTSIHSLDGRELGHFTLAEPFDAAIVDDARVAHGVTPVEAIDPSAPAYRDVLAVTFRRD